MVWASSSLIGRVMATWAMLAIAVTAILLALGYGFQDAALSGAASLLLAIGLARVLHNSAEARDEAEAPPRAWK